MFTAYSCKNSARQALYFRKSNVMYVFAGVFATYKKISKSCIFTAYSCKNKARKPYSLENQMYNCS